MLYKKKIYKFIFYLSTLLPIIYIINIIIVHSYSKLNSGNFILGIISIPCCILYYRISQDSNLFMYVLIYLSIFIENTSDWIISSNSTYCPYFYLYTLFIFRVLIIFLILFPNNKFSLYLRTHKKNSILLTAIINCTLLLIDYSIKINLNQWYLKFFTIFFHLITSLSILILLTLMYKSAKSKSFIETTYSLSLILLSSRVIITIFKNPHERFIAFKYSDALFFISFFIILIGLFIEINDILLKNSQLNKDVEIISNNIKEIKEVEKLRGQFFANLSHELKTPINIIFSTVQLLNSKKRQSIADFLDSYEKYDKTIRQNCYRMIRLVNNLVDLTKIDSGFISANFNNYNIVNLVENICMSVVPYLENKGITLTFDTLFEDIIIKCDSDYIERIILNIFSNSIKFSNNNGNIFVLIDADKDFITIKISDDGIGIDKDKLDSVFEPFIQSDKSLTRKKEGSGIGLSLVKSLVELHNGLVYFNPDIDKGSEIIIKLPNIQLPPEKLIINNSDYTQNNTLLKIDIEFSDIYD